MVTVISTAVGVGILREGEQGTLQRGQKCPITIWTVIITWVTHLRIHHQTVHLKFISFTHFVYVDLNKKEKRVNSAVLKVLGTSGN